MNLFGEMTYEPLAEKLRPVHVDEIAGQDHLIGPGKLITNILESGRPFSLILWGPPGCGKTTLARIIAHSGNYIFREVSAVTSGLPEVKKIIADAQQHRMMGQNVLLFIDEIHRFNKAQQDAFLPHVEKGTVSLIGATTENPSFEVIGPLLSRCHIVQLQPIKKDVIITILNRGTTEFSGIIFAEDALQEIAELSGGDARRALNLLELVASLGSSNVGVDQVKQALQRSRSLYDKKGEYHYDTVSAFIKSLRGSEADAALFYLGRMLNEGEDPKFIARRMVIFASEDIGPVQNAALQIAILTFDAVQRIGLPECEYHLVHCALVLARSPKSRIVADSLVRAKEAARRHADKPVPLHLRNAVTPLMKELGYGKSYDWQAGFQPDQGFLPVGVDPDIITKLNRPDPATDDISK